MCLVLGLYSSGGRRRVFDGYGKLWGQGFEATGTLAAYGTWKIEYFL